MRGNVILRNQIPCLFVRARLRIFLQGLATNENQHVATSQLRSSHLQLPAVLLEISYQFTAKLIKTVKIDIWALGVFIDGLLCHFKFRSRKLLLRLVPFAVRSLSHPKNIFATVIARSSVPSSSPHAMWSLGCTYGNKLAKKNTPCITISHNIPFHEQKFWYYIYTLLSAQISVLWGSNNLLGKDGFTRHQACGCTTPRWWWLLRLNVLFSSGPTILCIVSLVFLSYRV